MTLEVEEINRKLVDYYGIETESNNPMFRIIWGPDQYEYRESDVTPNGIHLIHPTVQYLPKYKGVYQDRWILERLVIVPDFQQRELGGLRKSYEPLWTFENAYDGTYLPANLSAARFVIDAVLAASGKKSLAIYKEMMEKEQNKEGRLSKLMEELFGDESSLMLRTVTGEAVAYTGPTFEEKINGSTRLDEQQSSNTSSANKSDG